MILAEDNSEIGRWPVLAEKARELMDIARQTAAGGYRQVKEDGPDVCDSESDSDNSEHGEMWSHAEMYTPDMLESDGKPKNGGPLVLSQEQVRAQKAAAAHRAPDSARSTAQASQPPVRPEPTKQAPTSSGPLAPLDSDAGSSAPPKVAQRKSTKGRAGGQETAGVKGEKDTQVAHCQPSDILPTWTLCEAPQEGAGRNGLEGTAWLKAKGALPTALRAVVR
jgi:hypothetical protein